MTDYSKQVNKFTNNIEAIIGLNNITREEFFNDINALKDKSLGINKFKSKYIEIFDGTFSRYKATKTTSLRDNFLGSYRRNMNPNYYNQVKSKKVIQFNQELRFQTTEKEVIRKKIAKSFKTTTAKVKRIKTTSKFHENKGYFGFARSEVARLKQTWELKEVINNKLHASHEIQIRLNYDVIDENGNIINTDIWNTFRSNYTPTESLLNRYDVAFDKIIQFVSWLEQSKLFIKLKKVCTYVMRHAE